MKSGIKWKYDKEIFEQLFRTGYVGEQIFVICSRNISKVKKSYIDKVLNRIGWVVNFIPYETLTNKKGKSCIEDAIHNLLEKSNLKNATIIGIRGKNGPMNLFYIGESENTIIYKWNKSGTHMYGDTFINDCLNDVTIAKDIDRYIEYWHTHDTSNSLQEYLGFTEEEFERYIQPQTCSSTFIKDVIKSRKADLQ